MRTLIASLTLFVLSTPALAQTGGSVPGMQTMDRFGQESKFGTSLTYVGFDDGAIDATGLRFDMYGQFISMQGFGGYGVFPLGYLDGDGDSSTAIGNIELGGLYIIPGNVPVILRGGLALGTAGDDVDDFGAHITSIYARFTDAPQAIPDTTWLRLSAHPIFRSGNGFFQADVGLDIPVDEGDGDPDPLIRINVGGGVETGGVALMGELVNTGTTQDDVDNRWVTFLGFTVRFMNAGQLRPAISFQLPIDDEIDDALDFNIIFGLEYVVPGA